MEQKNVYRFSIFASEENFELICKYSIYLGMLNTAVEEDCAPIISSLGLDEKKSTKLMENILKGMLPHYKACDNIKTISEMAEALENCIKNYVAPIFNNEKFIDCIKLEADNSSFANYRIYNIVHNYNRTYNQIMSNAYVDISSKVNSVVYHKENAEDIIQLVAMRVIKKLVVISEKYLSVNARAALLASMGDFEIKSFWRKNGNIIYEVNSEDDNLNSNSEKQLDDEQKIRITSMEVYGGEIADKRDFESEIVDRIASHEDVLFVLSHILDVEFVDSINLAFSFVLMLGNRSFRSGTPFEGMYSIEKFSGKYTYRQLRTVINNVIIDVAETCDSNIYAEVDSIMEKYDNRLVQVSNDGTLVGDHIFYMKDKKTLSNDYNTLRRRCYRNLIDKVSYKTRKSLYDKSSNGKIR